MADDGSAVVIDAGSGTVKAGFAGDDAPRAIFPTVVGHRRQGDSQRLRTGPGDSFVGNDVHYHPGILLSLKRPIEAGQVCDWDDMEKILRYTCDNELRIAPEERPFLLTESPFNPKVTREKMAQTMFESFNVPAFYLAVQATLAIYASGLLSGCVVDLGDGHSQVVPVCEGSAYTLNSQRSTDMAGRHLTDYMAQLLQERGYFFNTESERETVRDIKEKLAYVANDMDEEMAHPTPPSSHPNVYELPDGQLLSVGSERFQCAEALFDPYLVRSETPAIHHLICKSIVRCEGDMRTQLFNSVVLVGGSSMFTGMRDRLQTELANIAPPSTKIRVVAQADRKYAAWVGGSIFASLSSFATQWVSQAEYNENGPRVVHWKCF